MIDTKDLDAKYVASLAKLPPWKCGRIDLNTSLTEPVRVGRVESDVVRYIYFDDGEEVIVLGQRADEMAYAASRYRALLDALDAARAENARMKTLLQTVTYPEQCGFDGLQNESRYASAKLYVWTELRALAGYCAAIRALAEKERA